VSDPSPVLDFAADVAKGQIPDTADTRLAYLFGAISVHRSVVGVVLGLSDDPGKAAIELASSLAVGLQRISDAFAEFPVTPPGAEP
jgi:hypothetical protein